MLQGAGKSLLQHLIIQGANTGLQIEDSAPTLRGLTVAGCAQAGIHLMDQARPTMTCSFITGNEGQGGMVLEGEGLAPVLRNNVFANNMPFQVQSYAPIEIDLTGNYWGLPNPILGRFSETSSRNPG